MYQFWCFYRNAHGLSFFSGYAAPLIVIPISTGQRLLLVWDVVGGVPVEKKWNFAVVVTVCIATKLFVAKATQTFFTKIFTILYAI